MAFDPRAALAVQMAAQRSGARPMPGQPGIQGVEYASPALPVGAVQQAVTGSVQPPAAGFDHVVEGQPMPHPSGLPQHGPVGEGGPVDQFNPYAAGGKHYGGGRSAPNVGMTSNMAGYGRRDAIALALKNRGF